MLHHLDRVRFASFVFSALFRNTFVCSTAAAWQNRQTGSQPGKPTGCRHCKLSFAFASCSNASSAAAASAANAQLLAMVKRCSSPSRVASSLFAALLCLPSLYLLLPPSIVSHVAWWCGAVQIPHLVSGGASGAFSFFVMLCRSTIAPLIALISDLK